MKSVLQIARAMQIIFQHLMEMQTKQKNNECQRTPIKLI